MNQNKIKKEALENHRKMWNWIADKSWEIKERVTKTDYFEQFCIETIENNCFMCEYAIRQEGYCKNCLIEWNGSDKEFCCARGSYYSKFTMEKSYQKRAYYARKIANLPERFQKECENTIDKGFMLWYNKFNN